MTQPPPSAQLPLQVRLLRGVTLADGARYDVAVSGDRVTRVTPAEARVGAADEAALDPEGAVLDLDGFVLLTAPADPHAHLDKALSAAAIDPPLGDLGRAIASWKAYAATMTEDDIADRARRQALAMLAQGTTAVRTHVDMLAGDDPLRGARALIRVRDELADLVDLQLVALAGPDVPDAVIDAALDAGVDLVGGAPHLAASPLEDTRRLIAVADRRGVGADLHTDESLDGPVTVLELARLVRDRPADRDATAGHCVRLGTMEEEELAEALAAISGADLGIVTLPITNLYLQGWDHPVATPRGLPPLRRLLDAGVRLGAGGDNVADPFNPVGRSDALETAALLVAAGHLTPDEAYALVSDGARDVMRLPVAGPVEGAAAELLAVRAGSVAEAVARASADRVVIHRGRVVAWTRTESAVAEPTAGPAPVPVPGPSAPALVPPVLPPALHGNEVMRP
ncbi:amidohydrolase family protein [Clavibacter sp. Sh2141]|uniref:amidohydrolase family protein n=1 Tax=Clavibacter sp. Sh2141 TaxID=3395374 RepID=UPI0039BC3058